MAKQLTKDQKSYFWNNDFTLKGRIFFPNLITPGKSKFDDKEKWSVCFAWPIVSDEAQQETVKRMGEFVLKGMQHCWPGRPLTSLINPIKKFDTYVREDGEPNAEYFRDCYWFNASSNVTTRDGKKRNPPIVVDIQKQRVEDESLIYSGRNALVSFSFFAYQSGKTGVGVNLGAVMLLEGGEHEGGERTVDLDTAFKGFEADMQPSMDGVSDTNNNSNEDLNSLL